MNKTQRWQVLLIAFWGFTILTAMFLLSQKKQTSFDPENKLMLASMSAELEKDITETFSHITKQKNKQVFHITDKNCRCAYLSKSHIRKLDNTFLNNEFNVQTLDITQHPQLSSFIPSVPAIVIFDKQGKLGYLGPYSSGIFCNPKSSIIETIADSIIHEQHLGATVISESTGCYCKT